MHPKVAILLPTFNGEKYLAEQLDSLVGQTCENLIIVTRDDGSSDGSPGVIRSYAERFPEKFHSLENSGRRLGAGGSFSFLTQYVLDHKKELGLDRAYMLFCDQDDTWAKNKIELEMNAMNAAEDGIPFVPILVYSDMKVVSGTGKPLAASFMSYQGLDPKKDKFGQILFCNTVAGCTALINESLARKSLPVPETAVMHDWWLALVASAFGRLVFVDQALVSYRQHDSNTFGAVEKSPALSFRRLAGKIRPTGQDPALYNQAAQAGSFLERYRSELKSRQKTALRLTSLLRIRSGIVQKIFLRLGRKL